MTPIRITIVLTILAAVVVVLTRVRLSRNDGEAAGRLSIPKDLLNTHTGVGLLALATWTAFLVTRTTIIGWIGLLFWWVVVIAGLLILTRWMPAKGRHSSNPVSDTWGEGPRPVDPRARRPVRRCHDLHRSARAREALSMRSRFTATALVIGGLVVAHLTVAPTPAEAAGRRPAVVEHRVIGHSMKGRPIHAWRVGDPGARVKAVVIASMHGDEIAPRQILRSIRDGAPVKGIDLWLIPTHNPDGVSRGNRKNARGVDLNRNFPRKWADLDGQVESGRRPASERETRRLMRFLNRIDPRYVVSFHQPLRGIDTYGSKNRRFARRLAENLNLPRKEFACGSTCHGTFTQWFNHNHRGTTVTVEYGKHPSRRTMNARAPRQLLRALGGHR